MVTATLMYHKYLRAHEWSRAGWYGTALALMGAGLLFKEAAATLPAVLLLLEALGPKVRAPGGVTWPRALMRSLPFWAIGVGHLVYLSRPLQSYNPGLLKPELLMVRLPGSLETLARYVALLLFPATMRPFYGLPRPTSLLEAWPLAGAGVLVGLVTLGLLAWRRLPAAAFGLGWFLLTVAPYLDLLAISPRGMGLADRYLYGPSVGFLLVVAVLVDSSAVWLARYLGLSRNQWLGMTTGVLTVVYVGLAAWYMPVWRDNLSLYSRMVRDSPQAAEPHLNLGMTYLDLGQVDRGIVELETAVRLRPQWVRSQIPLALAYVEFRDPTEGFRMFDRIAAAAAGEYFYYVMRGRAHLLVKQPQAAREVLQAGLQQFPASLTLHYLLAHAQEAQGNAAGALEAYRRVLALDPRLASAYEGIGKALVEQGEYRAAARAFRQGLSLRPDHLPTLRLLALALEADGREQESLALWRKVAEQTEDPGIREEALKRTQRQSALSPPAAAD